MIELYDLPVSAERKARDMRLRELVTEFVEEKTSRDVFIRGKVSGCRRCSQSHIAWGTDAWGSLSSVRKVGGPYRRRIVPLVIHSQGSRSGRGVANSIGVRRIGPSMVLPVCGDQANSGRMTRETAAASV
jgi:hypothetical protein